MPAKRGNPSLGEVRNSDTTAANLKRVTASDEHARRMYDLLIRGKFAPVDGSKRELAQWLNANGFFTRAGKMWTARTVARYFDRMRDRGLVG